MNIYGFEQGKQTEKAIKNFLGLPAEVSKAGQIDAIYNGISIEVKRGNSRLYAGHRFNECWTASTATYALYSDSIEKEGNALAKSEKVAYSTDGTIEHTYIMETELFLYCLAIDKATTLYRRKDGRMELKISATKNFLENIKSLGMLLTEWKAKQDTMARAWG